VHAFLQSEYTHDAHISRFRSRVLPHEDFSDYLRGRYYLSPSKLYSVVRLQPNKQGYDVPVEGDWVTIAVVAERGPLRYSKAPIGVGKEDVPELSDKDSDIKSLGLDAPSKSAKPEFQRWKGKTKEEPSKPSGKKYMNLKLVDFGCRSKSPASAGKSFIRGDALLSLLLFESDRVEEVERDDGRKEKIYRGGSRGAFERMSKLKEGAVVALLNPRIFKPFQVK
jgi:minichromosome maintenance protein 10